MFTIRNALVWGCLAFGLAACGATTRPLPSPATAPVRANTSTQTNATVRAQSATAPMPDAVLLIHGIDIFARSPTTTASGWSGTDCEQVWSQTEDAFARWGYPRDRIQTVGYYQNNLNCGVDLSKRYQGEPFDGTVVGDDITTNTPINLIGWRLARYIYETYTVRGKSVAIVTHSMGGLIARYAVGGAARGMFSEWGVNALNVQSLVTLAGPHGGSESNALLSQLLHISFVCGEQCDQMLPNSTFLTALNSSIDDEASTVGKRLTLGSTADGIVPVLSASGAPGVHLTYSAPDYTHTAFQGGAGQMKNDVSEDHDATWYALGDTDIEEGSRPACAVAQFVFGGCRSAYGFTVNTISFPDETGQNIAIVGKTCGIAPYVEGIDIAGFLEFKANQNASDAKLLLDGTLISGTIADSGTRGTGQKYIVLSTPKPYSFSPPSGVSTTAGEHTLIIEAMISNPSSGLAPQRVVRQAVFTAVPKENCSNPPAGNYSIPATGDSDFDKLGSSPTGNPAIDNANPQVICAGYGVSSEKADSTSLGGCSNNADGSPGGDGVNGLGGDGKYVTILRVTKKTYTFHPADNAICKSRFTKPLFSGNSVKVVPINEGIYNNGLYRDESPTGSYYDKSYSELGINYTLMFSITGQDIWSTGPIKLLEWYRRFREHDYKGEVFYDYKFVTSYKIVMTDEATSGRDPFPSFEGCTPL